MEASEVNLDWSQVAVAMCDRHFGVGADGLLVLLPSHLADSQMHIFNPDGSEAEACGNGLRCLAKYFVDMGLANTGAQEILVKTMSGIRRVKFHKEIIYRGKVEGAKPLRNLYFPLSFEGEGFTQKGSP